MADFLATVGFGLILVGVYLAFGLPPALILAGAGLIYTAVRLEATRRVDGPADTVS